MRPPPPLPPPTTQPPMRQVGIPYRGLIGALPSFPPLRQPRPPSDFTCSHLAFLVSYCFLLCDICPGIRPYLYSEYHCSCIACRARCEISSLSNNCNPEAPQSRVLSSATSKQHVNSSKQRPRFKPPLPEGQVEPAAVKRHAIQGRQGIGPRDLPHRGLRGTSISHHHSPRPKGAFFNVHMRSRSDEKQ